MGTLVVGLVKEFLACLVLILAKAALQAFVEAVQKAIGALEKCLNDWKLGREVRDEDVMRYARLAQTA
jgi:hypothetical protein